ncbi:MAG: hypothetical protein JWN99_2290 [Ilumatobacteraceae bacterium]|nr:hypothetical protein [Ilumatobacteraceae bacterium]
MTDAQGSQVAVFAKLPAAPGKRDELAQAFRAAIASADAEGGTTHYILHNDAKDPDVLWVYERYTDQAAFEAHSAAPGLRALGSQLAPLMAGRPELTMLEPLFGKGF